MKKRTTLVSPNSIEGIGLHSGKTIHLTIKPSATAGVRFVRTDLSPPVSIVADPANVVNTTRSTTVGKGDAEVSTIEHIMSAFSGCHLTNVIVEVDGPEIPILDGSAKPFVQLIEEAGIETLEAEAEEVIIEETLILRHEESGAEIIAVPADEFEVQVFIDFPGSIVSNQTARLSNFSLFEDEISQCRTFVFTNELKQLLDSGLIKGGDLNNALVVMEKDMTESELSALAEKMDVKINEFPSDGILAKDGLYFENELARHKLLDLIGDLALINRDIKGRIIATKPGHKINTEFAGMLKELAMEQRRLKGKPKYDPNAEPIKNTEELKAMLPHRFPFLLVDKIIELSDGLVVGVKNVTFNENFFQGHFPGNPVMPGVLQLEGLAQTGGILALSQVPDPHNWDTYFLKLDDVKFKNKVVPGDTLIYKMELASPIRRGIINMKGTAYVGNKVVSEGSLTAQIVRRNVEDN